MQDSLLHLTKVYERIFVELHQARGVRCIRAPFQNVDTFIDERKCKKAERTVTFHIGCKMLNWGNSQAIFMATFLLCLESRFFSAETVTKKL